jgi:hypothetical protein
MDKISNQTDVYLESGSKKVFAGSIHWPGWCRPDIDESSALQALLTYAPRYAKIMGGMSLGFSPPADVSQLVVVDRLEGGKRQISVPRRLPPQAMQSRWIQIHSNGSGCW